VQRLSSQYIQRAWPTTSGVSLAIVLAFYLAQSTIEGVGEAFFVSVLWAVIFYAILFPSCALGRMLLSPPNRLAARTARP
jgi:hypothetical protein